MNKPKFDHKVIRKFHYTPAVQTSVAATIKRARQELRAKAERERQNEIERQAKTTPIKKPKVA